MKLLFCTLFLALTVGSFYVPDLKTQSVFTLNDFGKPVELKGKEISLPGIEFPAQMTVIPEKRVFMFIEAATRSSKKWLHIYSLDSLKLIHSLINYGKGEGTQSSAFRIQYDNRNGGEVYILDASRRQIFIYKADSLIAGNDRPFKIIGNKFNEKVTVTAYENIMYRATVINNSYDFIDTRMNLPNTARLQFNKYRNDFSIKDSFGVYPKTEIELQPEALAMFLDGCLGLSTNNKYTVLSCLNTDYLAVYDTSGEKIASGYGPNELEVNDKPEKTESAERTVPLSNHKGYGGMARMNKSSIYVLYDGKNSRSSDFHSSELLRFSTRLQPETRYKLNVPVYSLDIDWRAKRVYGLRKEDTTSKFVIFSL